jgi:hypothetical protein
MGGQYLRARGKRTVVDAGAQPFGRAPAKLAKRLAHRGQRGGDDPARVDVVETRHRDIARNTDARLLEFAQDADGHLVVGARDHVRQRPARQQAPGRGAAAGLREVPVQHRVDAGARVLRDGGQERGQPSLRVRGVGWAGHEAQPPVAVGAGQVCGERADSGRVVDGDNVQFALVALARDDDNRDPPRQRAQPARGHDLLGHQQAVDFARQRPDAPLELLTGPAERQQQRALGSAQYRLDRVHDLVHEQLTGFLDVDLIGAALQGGQPDDVLAAAAQALGRPVRHETQLVDGGPDALLRAGVHEG